MTTLKPNTKEALEKLQNEAENLINPLGYEVVALEQKTTPSSTSNGHTLVLYIDFFPQTNHSKRISLDDCIAVNKVVDTLFENTNLLEGHFTLEVSSPGDKRPLRKLKDYQRFVGQKARVHTLRPLESVETENLNYWEKNKNQKNFSGKLEGLTTDEKKVKMSIEGTHITIPIDIISKAHLEFAMEEK